MAESLECGHSRGGEVAGVDVGGACNLGSHGGSLLRRGTTAVEEICNCLNGHKRTAVKCHVTRAHPWPCSSQHVFSCVSDAVGGGPYGGKQNTWCTRESVDKKRERPEKHRRFKNVDINFTLIKIYKGINSYQIQV